VSQLAVVAGASPGVAVQLASSPSSRPRRALRSGSPAWWYIDRIVRGAEPSRVNVRAVRFTRRPAPPGTRTPSARPSTSPRVCTSPRRRVEEIRARRRHLHACRGVVLAQRCTRPLHDPPVHHRSPGDGRPEAGWGEHKTDEEYSSRW